MRQHKLKLPKNPGMAGLGLDMMAGGSIFDSDVVDTPSMTLVDPVLGGQVILICHIQDSAGVKLGSFR